MNGYFRIRFVVVLTVMLCARTPSGADTDYRIGVAKSDITPSEPVVLAGYGGRTKPFEGIDTKLWARAIAMNDGDQQLVISVDNCGVPKNMVEAIYAKIKANHTIDRASFVVCSTHTHNAPALPGYAKILWQERVSKNEIDASNRYAQWLEMKLVALANRVLTNQIAANISWGQGKVSFGGNRRVLNDGSWTGFGFQHNGPVDHSVPILVARDSTNKVIGIWTNYACHCTTLGSVNRVAGDWVGFANDELERLIPEAISVTTIGCGADVGPQPSGNSSLAMQHGKSLATEVHRVMQSGTGIHGPLVLLKSSLSTNESFVELPFQSTYNKEYWAKRAMLRGFEGVHGREMQRELNRLGKIRSQLKYRISTWQFGEQLGIVFFPGEVCVDYAVRLKKENDWRRLWINGWSNDVPCYIPSKRVLSEGGYEADFSMVYYAHPSRFSDSAEDIIIAATNELLGEKFKTNLTQHDSQRIQPNLFAHPGPESWTRKRFQSAVENFNVQEKRLFEEFKVMAQDALSGFDSVVFADFEETVWFDYLGRKKSKRPFVRQLKIGDRVEWQTEKVVPKKNGTLIFCFAGGTGWRSQAKTNGFELRIDGKTAIRFDITRSISRWVHGNTELFYLPIWMSEEDSAGFFLLRMRHLGVNQRQALTLSVHSLGSGSQRWFAVDKYRDAVTKLHDILR